MREEENQEKEQPVAGDEYVNSDDLFYWMEDTAEADVPMRAIWIDMPMGCRFCC